MSVEAITWALSQDIKPSGTKFVLVAVANCADGRDFIAWPSVAYLADATGQDRKTVLAGLSRLMEQGYLEDTGERRGLTKQIIVYRVNQDRQTVPKAERFQKRNGSNSGTVPETEQSQNRNSTAFPLKESQNSLETVPKTGHGTVRNHKGTNTPLTPQGGRAGDSDKSDKPRRLPRMTLKTFFERCREKGEKAISGYAPIQQYVEDTGLPMEFIQLAWDRFKLEFGTHGPKATRMQADWRRHFLNFVRNGYFRLWYVREEAGGREYRLTSVGEQASAEIRSRNAREHREAA